jgi:RNA polymerase sigma factor (TIGR02999 family)
MTDVTRILSDIESGDPSASEQLLPLVYEELRKLATAKLAQEKPGQTLQATALVHEAYLRLVDTDRADHWNSRGHFFAAATEAMRRILVDQARRKAAAKWGGDFERMPLDEIVLTTDRPEEVVAVHDALNALEQEDAVTADVVKLHYFGGFSLEEAADLLGMSRATAYRLWTYARAWLRAALDESL